MFVKKLNKDNIRRHLSNRLEIKILVLKTLFNFRFQNSSKSKIWVLRMFDNLNKKFFKSRVNNMCIISGRQNGVYRLYKMSRIKIRDSKYSLFGLRKSSW